MRRSALDWGVKVKLETIGDTAPGWKNVKLKIPGLNGGGAVDGRATVGLCMVPRHHSHYVSAGLFRPSILYKEEN